MRGAHAAELGHVHESVLEDGLGDLARAVGQPEQRHHLGLHVRGESRERARDDVGGLRAAGRHAANTVTIHAQGRPALLELGEGRRHVTRSRAGDGHVSVRDGGRREQGARLDPVGDDAVPGAAELSHPFDLDALGARALDARAHGGEEPRQVGDLRLAGRVLDAPSRPPRARPPS